MAMTASTQSAGESAPLMRFRSAMVVCRVAFTALVLISGTCLPLFDFGRAGKMLNPFWESLYGLGLLFGGFLPGGLDSRLVFLLGGIIWPLALSTLLFLFSRIVVRARSRTSRLSIIVAGLLSLVVVVPLDIALRPPLNYLPFYSTFLAVIY